MLFWLSLFPLLLSVAFLFQQKALAVIPDRHSVQVKKFLLLIPLKRWVQVPIKPVPENYFNTCTRKKQGQHWCKLLVESFPSHHKAVYCLLVKFLFFTVNWICPPNTVSLLDFHSYRRKVHAGTFEYLGIKFTLLLLMNRVLLHVWALEWHCSGLFKIRFFDF